MAQRNAALRRAAAGLSSRDAIAPWTERVATLGAELVAARLEALAALEPGFREIAGDARARGGGARLRGRAADARRSSRRRLDRDLDRATTSLGPHLHDVRLLAGDRDLRGFGSQGEQRLTVLALLLAEARLLATRRDVPPLLLLDDVLSELDTGRRRGAERRSSATRDRRSSPRRSAAALPVEPAQLVEVEHGTAR